MRRLATLILCVMGIAACGGGSGAPPDAGVYLGDVATGTRLAAGDVDFAGITADGWVAAHDWTRGALAVPLAGGEPRSIAGEADAMAAGGNTIVVYRNWDYATTIGDLSAWTAAHGAQPIASASSGILAMNEDGSRLLATRDTSADGTSTTVILSGVDGAPPTVIGPAARTATCGPRAVYGAGTFVVARCEPLSSTLALAAVDVTTGAVTNLLGDVKTSFTIVRGAVAAVRSDGGAVLLPLGGGASQPIADHVDAVVATPDGALLVRRQGAISRVSLDGSPAVTLVPGGAEAIRDVSPDGTWLLYRTMIGPRHGYGDLLGTSARIPFAPVTLSTGPDSTTFGSSFTADSSRVLYITDADDVFTGTLHARRRSGEGDATTLGTRVWFARAYADTRVVFLSDYSPIPEGRGRGVLRAADAASTGAPIVLATAVGATFALTPRQDAVVYSVNDGTDRAGIYVAPLPGGVPVQADGGTPDGAGDAPMDAASESAATDAGPADAPPESAPDPGPDAGAPPDADGAVDAAIDAEAAEVARDGDSDAVD